MDAIAYTRISTKDQSTYSLDYQERSIRQYCKQHELQLLAVFRDDGESSYTWDRPDWKALEKFIRKNKSVEYLIIFDHDRFSRNLAEALIKIKELHDKFGIKVLATTDNFNTDFSDPSTFMMRAFKFMMAESELHRIRKRTKEGYIEASLKGLYVNKAPYGYLNSRDKEQRPMLKIDEDKAVIVRLIFQEYNRGANVEDVKQIVAPYGYKQKGNSAIQRILSNPVYAGLIKVPAHGNQPEKIVQGLHPAIVSENDYWVAQDRLTGNKRIGMNSNEEVPLKGVLRCNLCGRMLSASHPTSKSGKSFWYYICSNHRKNLSAKKLHQQMNEILDLFSFEPKRLNWFADSLSEEISKFLYSRAELVSKTHKAARQVDDKIADAEEKYLLQEGRINKKTFEKVMAGLKAQQTELQKRLRELDADQNSYWRKLNALLPKLNDVRGAYEQLDFYRRQQFLNLVFSNSLTHDGTTFRTRSLHPMFSHNALILKERGLLIIEQPSSSSGDNSRSYPDRERNGTLLDSLMLFSEMFAA